MLFEAKGGSSWIDMAANALAPVGNVGGLRFRSEQSKSAGKGYK